MRRWLFFGFGFVAAFIIAACNALDNSGLSENEIVDGLKTALTVGADSSVTITSAVNGYLKDEAIKILLPDEAKVITDNIHYVNDFQLLKALNIDLNAMVDKTVTSMNRAAESAAKQAAPIFKSAITNLNISDGLTILNGKNPANNKKSATSFDSTAATNYLVSTTRDTLKGLYAKPIDGELSKDLGLGFSANTAWTNLTAGYNTIASNAKLILDNDIFGLLSSDQTKTLKKFVPIQQTTLGNYVTGKALDGLFLKVGDQERSIRRDPWQWISDKVGTILQKVFGQK